MKMISNSAVIDASPPTRMSFLKLNSSPRLNSRKITPISANVSIFSTSATVGSSLKCGPTRKPAMIYQSTSGCLILRNINVVTAPAMRISARS